MKYCKILTATKEQTAESVFTADAVWSLGYKHPTAGWSAMAKVSEDNPRLVQFRTVESGGTVHNFTLQLGREFFYKGAITNSTLFYGADTLCADENKPYEVCLLICGYTYSNYYSSTSSSTSSMYTPWRIWAVFDIRTGENKASSVAYTSGSGSSYSSYLHVVTRPSLWCYYNATYSRYYAPFNRSISSSTYAYVDCMAPGHYYCNSSVDTGINELSGFYHGCANTSSYYAGASVFVNDTTVLYALIRANNIVKLYKGTLSGATGYSSTEVASSIMVPSIQTTVEKKSVNMV